jgi:tRNA nucleotidyltransferase (CCA-adding enzyme)
MRPSYLLKEFMYMYERFGMRNRVERFSGYLNRGLRDFTTI